MIYSAKKSEIKKSKIENQVILQFFNSPKVIGNFTTNRQICIFGFKVYSQNTLKDEYKFLIPYLIYRQIMAKYS
jgi:hypothetical protein